VPTGAIQHHPRVRGAQRILSNLVLRFVGPGAARRADKVAKTPPRFRVMWGDHPRAGEEVGQPPPTFPLAARLRREEEGTPGDSTAPRWSCEEGVGADPKKLR